MASGIDVLSILASILLTLGIPVLVVLFFLEGLILGKILRPGAVFILYLVVVRPSLPILVIVIALGAIATTLGETTMYLVFEENRSRFRGLPEWLSFIERAPALARTKIPSGQIEFMTRMFDRFGGTAVAVSNVVPGVRCLSSIPAGLSHYAVKRFVGFSLLGNLVYMSVLYAITRGLVEIVTRFVPWV